MKNCETRDNKCRSLTFQSRRARLYTDCGIVQSPLGPAHGASLLISVFCRIALTFLFFLTNIGHRSKQVHFLTCLRHFYAVLQWNSGQPVRAPYTIIPLLFFVYYHFRLVIRGGVMLPCTLPNKRAAFI